MIKDYSFPQHIAGLWLTANQLRRASGYELTKRELKQLVKIGVFDEKKTMLKEQSVRTYKLNV